MTGHSKLYFDDNFSSEKAKHYTLLIQIRNTDFSFAAVHQDVLVAWGKNYPLAELLAPNELGKFLNPSDYQKVIIGLTPTVFSLLPKKVYLEERTADFMRVLDVKLSDKAYSQSLDADNLVLFKDHNEIVPKLTERYTKHQIVFAYKGWLQALAPADTVLNNLYLDIQPNEVHIAYYKSSRLRFYNRFTYAAAEELAYFTALVTNELQLNPVNTRLLVSGDVSAGDNKLAGLSEFFPKIDLSQLKQLAQIPDGIEPQQLHSLTALMLCV